MKMDIGFIIGARTRLLPRAGSGLFDADGRHPTSEPHAIDGFHAGKSFR